MLIAQLSDLHVQAPGHRYGGAVDANAHLTAAIEHLHRLNRRPDLVVLSGDLTDHGSDAEYAEALERLQSLALPFLVVAGNHDHRDRLRAAFAGHPYLPREGPLHYAVDSYPVRVVVVDTCVPGAHHGHVDAAGLRWLQQTLQEDTAKATLLVMHHPPFVCGIPYLDRYRYADAAPMERVLRGFSNIEAVLCGHVHRVMSRRWAGTVVLTCPSTTTEIALQWRADAAPQSHEGPAGCMLHRWSEDTGLVSHLSHIVSGPGPFPFF